MGRLRRAETLDDLNDHIVGLRDTLGVAHLIYHSVKSTGDQYAALTYPKEWVNRYVEQDYSRIDPVVQGCYGRFNPVNWRELDWSSRSVRNFLGEASDAGVGNQGLSVPLRGPNGQFALFTISDQASDDSWEAFTAESTEAVLLAAHYVNQRALEIEGRAELKGRVALSPRETDALTMLAMGLNRSQAADTLSISEHTLRVYIESARCKLEAMNTTHAVARALTMGLLVI